MARVQRPENFDRIGREQADNLSDAGFTDDDMEDIGAGTREAIRQVWTSNGVVPSEKELNDAMSGFWDQTRQNKKRRR